MKGSKLKSLNLRKNTKLDRLYIEGTKKVTKLDLRKNIQLYDLSIYGTKITSLDLSRNTSLRFLSLMSTLKLKRLTMPALKNQIIPVYHSRKRCKVETLDLSRIKKFTERTRGAYLHPFQFNQTYKKVIISKKVKKSDRNWFKKKAKKVKAKVIVK